MPIDPDTKKEIDALTAQILSIREEINAAKKAGDHSGVITALQGELTSLKGELAKLNKTPAPAPAPVPVPDNTPSKGFFDSRLYE